MEEIASVSSPEFVSVTGKLELVPMVVFGKFKLDGDSVAFVGVE